MVSVCHLSGGAQESNPTLDIRVSQSGRLTSALSYLNGYHHSLSGQTLAYHSSHPDADVALLCRVRRDASSISWETDTLVDGGKDNFYHLVWLAGIERIGWGNATLPHTFHLSVNGEPWFTFTNRKDSSAPRWTTGGKDGAQLSFQSQMVDRYGDLFGYMFLDLPKKNFSAGLPLQLRVDGEDAGSPEWYMAFQYEFSFVPRIRPEPVLLNGKHQSLLRMSLDNLQEGRTIDISYGRTRITHDTLRVGGNIFFVPVESVSSDRTILVSFTSGDGEAVRSSVVNKPVKPRTIFLISHTHNDIGYTDLQPNVEKKQWQNLDQALELIRQTDSYPDEAKFRWNIEILWPIESYIRNATAEKKEEVRRAVQEGRLGLNALFVNPLTGLAGPVEMSHFTDYSWKLSREFDFDWKTERANFATATVSDIPGFTWGIVTALSRAGVRYFASGPNTGDRIGHVLEAWGDKPFYWKSQSGKEEILFWMAGSGYSTFHEGSLSQLGEEKIMKITRRMEESAYPYEYYFLPYTLGDNGGPDPKLSDFVKAWNEKYASPVLEISTHRQMFETFEKRYGATLPKFQGDLTPYWEDGAASTAYETALNRHVVNRLIQGEALWSMRDRKAYPESLYYNAWRNVCLWDEHTWGADKSVDSPDDPGAIGQWKIKQKYVLDSDSLSNVLLNDALKDSAESTLPGAFDIYNTSSWSRSDVVTLLKAQSLAGNVVIDEKGSVVPSQRLSSGELVVLVKNIPPMSARRIFVKKGNGPGKGNVAVSQTTLRNEFISLSVDSLTGTISSLRSGHHELAENGKRLNEYFYVPGTNPDSALHLNDVHVAVKERGKLLSSLRITADAPGCRKFSSEIRLISGINRLEIINEMDKIAVREKEGVHFGFPFHVENSRIHYDVASAIVEPEKDQLPGSCKNFFSVQSWIDASAKDHGVSLITLDAPLVEMGAIQAESPWLKSLQPSPVFYSYVMNNYWHTNYKADQEGIVRFRYAICPHAAFDPAATTRLSRELSQPFVVKNAGRHPRRSGSLFTLTSKEVIVESVKPWILYLYNPTPKAQTVRIDWNKSEEITLNGDADWPEYSRVFTMVPWETTHIRVQDLIR
ncbi:MAG TPA: glycoside hydrolase family 38 C-terminal domain-containing protein [Bacteroidota bacterium]|jgi:hypothetical protein|nr:glycoside hydrolase family 38 C-terminal domain-containing protein [Bacteroidota bacterium]